MCEYLFESVGAWAGPAEGLPDAAVPAPTERAAKGVKRPKQGRSVELGAPALAARGREPLRLTHLQRGWIDVPFLS